MKVTTLKTLVLKTATVGSVKLPAPADRIGLGFGLVALYPAEVLSPGQFPMPHRPAPNTGPGPRQELSATRMREQTRAMATAEPPAGPAGRPVPGSTACRRPWSLTGPASWAWSVAAKRAAAAGRLATDTGATAPSAAGEPAATHSRASFRAGPSLQCRFGCDCQSPDRRDDRRPASRTLTPVAAAGK